MKLAAYLGVVIASIIGSGCASIVSKSTYPVTVTSEPSGAVVTIKNKHGIAMHKGTTPLTVTLPAGAGYFSPGDYSLDFEMLGYQPKRSIMQAGVDPWYIGNLVFGGAIGFLIVDPLTGAMWTLPAQKNVTLTSAESKVEASTAPIANP